MMINGPRPTSATAAAAVTDNAACPSQQTSNGTVSVHTLSVEKLTYHLTALCFMHKYKKPLKLSKQRTTDD
jgi:hypothetical protein